MTNSRYKYLTVASDPSDTLKCWRNRIDKLTEEFGEDTIMFAEMRGCSIRLVIVEESESA